jgi:hypothetical protein
MTATHNDLTRLAMLAKDLATRWRQGSTIDQDLIERLEQEAQVVMAQVNPGVSQSEVDRTPSPDLLTMRRWFICNHHPDYKSSEHMKMVVEACEDQVEHALEAYVAPEGSIGSILPVEGRRTLLALCTDPNHPEMLDWPLSSAVGLDSLIRISYAQAHDNPVDWHAVSKDLLVYAYA